MKRIGDISLSEYVRKGERKSSPKFEQSKRNLKSEHQEHVKEMTRDFQCQRSVPLINSQPLS